MTANSIGLFITESSDAAKRAWFYCRFVIFVASSRKLKHLVLLLFVLVELFVTCFDHLIIWRVCGVFHDDEDDDGDDDDDYKDDVSTI